MSTYTTMYVRVEYSHGEDLATGGWAGGMNDQLAGASGEFCGPCASKIIAAMKTGDTKAQFLTRFLS